VATGFDKIDDITSGLQKSDLIIIAGRRAWQDRVCLNIAQFAALELGVPVAIFSLEMAKEQLATRMLAAEARVDSQRLRKGFLGETDWPNSPPPRDASRKRRSILTIRRRSPPSR